MDDISIDQNKLPGVKEVCRDFAVLEDHCLAHNLQEQEIENHLASNIHKNRLVQQDLRVAKRLQEEEDQRAKVKNQKQQKDIERIDNEMAQEIQEQLVWQAEQQRQQEEKDEAIARKLQEREMKEERRRQKQIEAKLEEQYYEDRGACRPPSDPLVQYPGTDLAECGRERYRGVNRSRSPDHRYTKLGQKSHLHSQGNHNRHVDHYPDEIGSIRVPEHYKTGNRGRSDYKGRWPENHTSETRTTYLKNYLTEGNTFMCEENFENSRGRKYQNFSDDPRYYQELLMDTKERPYWSDSADRDKDPERKYRKETEGRKKRDKAQCGGRDKGQGSRVNIDTSRDQDIGQNNCRSKIRQLDMEKDKHGRKDREREPRKHQSRDRRRGRDLDDPTLPATIKRGSEESEENTNHSSKQRLHFGYDGVFEELSLRSDSKCQNPQERGRNIQGQYGMRDAVQGLAQMDLRAQEMRDIEVARRLQEEEVKASRIDKRAAQVAQDEEIARRLMEEDEREYRRSREKDKHAMERQQRRADGDFKPVKEDVIRSQTQEEYDYQRGRNPKPTRPPTCTRDYENVDSSYGHSDIYSPGPLSRPETAYKGAYYRQ